MTKGVFRIVPIAFAGFFLAGGAFAQEEPAVTPQEPVAAQEEPSASHLEAAAELMQTANVLEMAEAGANAMFANVRADPNLAPYEDVFRAWFKKVLEGGDYESRLQELYVRHFSEDELRRLNEFYRSPLGQKALEEMPAIMKESLELGRQLTQEHLPELHQMLDEARAERQPEQSDAEPEEHGSQSKQSDAPPNGDG